VSPSPNPDKPAPKKIKAHAKSQRRKEYAKVFLCDPFAPLREIFAFWALNFHFLPKMAENYLSVTKDLTLPWVNSL